MTRTKANFAVHLYQLRSKAKEDDQNLRWNLSLGLFSFKYIVSNHDPGGSSHWHSLAHNAECGNQKTKQITKKNKTEETNLSDLSEDGRRKVV